MSEQSDDYIKRGLDNLREGLRDHIDSGGGPTLREPPKPSGESTPALNKSIIHAAHHSEWYTPPALIQAIERAQGGRFSLDVATCRAAPWQPSAIAYSSWNDGLVTAWGGHRLVWCNPPYGRNITAKWCAKAIEELERARAVQLPVMIAMLLPASTDAKWWHALLEAGASVVFLRGRLSFIDGRTGKATGGNSGGSVIVILATPDHPHLAQLRDQLTPELDAAGYPHAVWWRGAASG